MTATAAFIVLGESPCVHVEERGEDLFFLNGGERRYVAEAPDVTQALALLDPLDDFNIVAFPGVVDPAVISWCEARRDCFCIVDGPVDSTSAYAAAYSPWVVAEDRSV